MSGIADGIIYLGVYALRAALTASAANANANAANASRNTYNNVTARQEEQRTKKRNNTQQSNKRSNNNSTVQTNPNETKAVSRSVNSVKNKMNASIDEQYKLNRETANAMQLEIERNRQQMTDLLQSKDEEKYEKYISQISTSTEQLTKKLNTMQKEINVSYQAKISKEMEQASNVINTQYNTSLQELQQLQNDMQAKNQKAAEIANDFIEETKNLLQILEMEYDAKKYSLPQLMELQKALNDAVSQYNMGNYEAAIAAAKNTTVDTMEEIFKTDCKKQEWENYYTLAASLSTELKAYLESQEVISEDVKNKAEQELGKPLDSDIVGINIGEYTDKMPDGQNEFSFLISKANEINSFLLSEQAQNLSTAQLNEYIDLINSKLYPAAAKAIYNGIMNMNNAFSRQNISEEIIDFFEEHNFDFKGYSYDDDRHDGALHIGLENDVTGEEIVVTLAPELMENGQVETAVEIHQLKGDETNEERKAFYRESIQNVVVQNTPGAQVKLECRKDTHNKLSKQTELRDKLR